jgi:hypothetical protein
VHRWSRTILGFGAVDAGLATPILNLAGLLIAQAATVQQAAQVSLNPGRMHERHAKPDQRVHGLIRRGQTEVVFGADIVAEQPASVLHHVLHGGGNPGATGRLDPTGAPRIVTEMPLAVCAVASARMELPAVR